MLRPPHPAPPTKPFSGVLQAKSLGDTFGTAFSSGDLNLGGGDSGAILEEQLQELLEQLEDRQTV